MQINSDMNILGGMPDYNLIRICIAGQADGVATEDIKLQYTSIRTDNAVYRFVKAINSGMNVFKTDNLKDMIQQMCSQMELNETLYLMLFYNFSLNNDLFAYMNEHFFFPALYSGRSTLTTEEAEACLKELATLEEDIHDWSASTINVTASKYLTMLKKMGLLDGKVKKQILHKTLTDTQFVYFLYWLMEAEETTNISDSKYMKYGFMEKQSFIKRCLQQKYTPYVNITYNGDVLRMEPKIAYKEIVHECEQH